MKSVLQNFLLKQNSSFQKHNTFVMFLRNLIPFVQFKKRKREKHPRRSVTFSKVAGF